MSRWMTVANIVTSCRLVFFVVFVWAAHVQAIQWMVFSFIFAWSLDAVDGWVARRLNQVTAFGYIFDKVVDRVVLFCGLLILLVNRIVPDYALLLLTKDISCLPVASLQVNSNRGLVGAGRMGKVISVMQGTAIVWLLLDGPLSFFVVLIVAISGAMVGGVYLYRVYYGNIKATLNN